jgi:hypothetical protein
MEGGAPRQVQEHPEERGGDEWTDALAGVDPEGEDR